MTEKTGPTMNKGRRRAFKAMAAAAVLPLFPGATAHAAWHGRARELTTINVVVPRDFKPPVTGPGAKDYRFRLSRAVLDYLDDNYSGRNMPVWRQKFGSVDLEKRVVNIVYWITKSVAEHAAIYPVDPAWVAGQIMTESFFSEFAVSRALAVGVCQFIPPTARSFGLVCAGDDVGLAPAPHAPARLAKAEKDYYQTREQWKKVRRRRNRLAPDPRQALARVVEQAGQGQAPPWGRDYLALQNRLDELDARVKQARKDYREFLKDSFSGKSIFNKNDLKFLKAFDQRVIYSKPVGAMVLMLARHLRARKGNILAAAAGYHAGLSSTRETDPPYAPYGRIPSYEDTVAYTSRLLINHHEIMTRLA